MNREIILSLKTFESIFIDDKFKKIREVFKEKVKFRFDIKTEELNKLREDIYSPLSIILKSYEGFPEPEPIENFEIEINKDTELKRFANSTIIYGNNNLLRDKFKSDFGLQWFTENEFSSSVFEFEIEKVFNSDESKEGKGWNEILSSFNEQPVNAFFLNDRYLFSHSYIDRINKENKNKGLINLIEILNSILPKKSEIAFNILICTEQPIKNLGDANKLNDLIAKIVFEINKIRDYKIQVEILLYAGRTKFHDLTHNRRLLMNYHLAKVEHAFEAIEYKQGSLTEIHDDTFYLSNMFNTKFVSDQYFQTLNSFKKILEHAIKRINENGQNGQNEHEYRLFRNGLPVNNVENRLFF